MPRLLAKSVRELLKTAGISWPSTLQQGRHPGWLLGMPSAAPAEALDVTFRCDTGLGVLHGHEIKAERKEKREKFKWQFVTAVGKQTLSFRNTLKAGTRSTHAKNKIRIEIRHTRGLL